VENKGGSQDGFHEENAHPGLNFLEEPLHGWKKGGLLVWSRE